MTLRLDGWAVERLVRVRPSRTSPDGYPKTVTAPGTPFRSRDVAEAEARRLNAPQPRSPA